MGGLLDGPKGMFPPPSQIIGGARPPWPPPLFLCLCNLQRRNRIYIRKTDLEMFEAAKVMVDQRSIQCTHGCSCKE